MLAGVGEVLAGVGGVLAGVGGVLAGVGGVLAGVGGVLAGVGGVLAGQREPVCWVGYREPGWGRFRVVGGGDSVCLAPYSHHY